MIRMHRCILLFLGVLFVFSATTTAQTIEEVRQP